MGSIANSVAVSPALDLNPTFQTACYSNLIAADNGQEVRPPLWKFRMTRHAEQINFTRRSPQKA